MQGQNTMAVGESQAVAASESLTDLAMKNLAAALKPHLDIDTGTDESEVGRIVDEKIANARLPRTIEIDLAGRSVTLSDRVHRQFDELLGLVNEGHKNLMMVGPAGTGKTTLAKSIAKALELDFAFISFSAGVTETHLFGRILPQADGSWGYQKSRFVEVYEQGGVFLLDEIDAADANVMVSINAALANGVLANPVSGAIHVRHADCLIIAAANTFGLGGDFQYVGRNQLDAATLDRFVLATLFVIYDTDLERDIATGFLGESRATALLDWVGDVRQKISDYRLRRVASTRLVENASKAMKAGRTLAEVKARFFVSWSADEKAKVGA